MSNSCNAYYQKGRVLLGECLDGIDDALIGSDYCRNAGDSGYDAPNKRGEPMPLLLVNKVR